MHDQQVLWSGGFGVADSRAAARRRDTIYSICSISKLFTSVAVMQQRDAGKLRLDDPVGRHLPWFTIKPAGGRAGEITIEGLLTHASGLPRESDYPLLDGPGLPRSPPTSRSSSASRASRRFIRPRRTSSTRTSG